MKAGYPHITLSLIVIYLLLFPLFAGAGELPKGFVYVTEVVPDIITELRYFTKDNFVGTRIDGYRKPRCIMTKEAAEALKEVQRELKQFALGLKIYDGYRPQRAVNHFARWARDLRDTKMKAKYYPHEAKKTLFKKGYIARRSGHSRGSTVDVTIVSFDNRGQPRDLDMGTGFDFFSSKSWPDDHTMTSDQRTRRMLLKVTMERHGFASYSKEWWHFSLRNEPYSHTYFDFPVQ